MEQCRDESTDRNNKPLDADGGGYVLESIRPDTPLPMLGNDPEVINGQGRMVEAVGEALARRARQQGE